MSSAAEDERINHIVGFIEELARRERPREIAVSDRRDVLDAIAYGLNFLGEELAKAEEAHREVARLGQLVRTSNDAFIGTDLDGAINLWNPAAERLFGWTRAEIWGRPLSILVPQDGNLRGSNLTAGTGTLETELLTKAGQRLQVSVQVSPQTDERGGPVGGYCIVRDITAQKHAEESLRRASQAKDEFLATMSHELRTPLNAILGLSEALVENIYGPLSPKQAETLRIVHQSGKHLLALLNDILDLSRLQSDQVVLDRHPVSVGNVVSSVVELLSARAREAGLTLGAPPIGRELFVLGEERRIRQILLNIVGNAVKFTPRGGTVSVAVQATATTVSIDVRDNGPGIPPHQRALVFQPFVQLATGLSRPHDGSGLGLALARRLARLMGGDVDLRSEAAGPGSCFTVSLPLRPDVEAPLAGL